MTQTPALVGLIGYKRSGKDTFAAVLAEEFGVRRVAFADPLRDAALALNPIVGRPSLPGATAPHHDVRLQEVVSAIGWERAKDYVPEVRGILQRLGTDAIRALDDTFWVRIAMRRVEDLRFPTDPRRASAPVVVTDVRFPNEAEAIKSAGGTIVRIVRPGSVTADPHPSEHALDDWSEDRSILNAGTVADLADVARYFARATL